MLQRKKKLLQKMKRRRKKRSPILWIFLLMMMIIEQLFLTGTVLPLYFSYNINARARKGLNKLINVEYD